MIGTCQPYIESTTVLSDIYFRSEIHLLTYYLNKIFFNDFDRPNKVMIECSETTEDFVGKCNIEKNNHYQLVHYMKGSEV